MQLGDYVHTTKRRSLIVLVAIAAAALTFGVLSQSPPRYSGSVRIDVPAESANSMTNTALYLANFSTALSSAEVRRAIAADLGVSTARVSGAPSVSQVGHSTVLRVSYIDESRDLASRGADVAARQGARSLAQRNVDQAKLKVDAAGDLYAHSVGELDTYQREHGSVVDSPAYAQLQHTVADLQGRVDTANATGNASQASSLQAQLDTARSQLTGMREQSREESGLQRSAEAALSDLNSARRDLTSAQGAADRISTPPFVSAGTTTEESQTMAWAQASVLAAVLAGAAMFVCIALADTSARRRRRQRAAAASEAREIDLSTTRNPVGESRKGELERPVRV